MTTNALHAEQLVRLDAEIVEIEAAMREAVREAVLMHKRAGLPLVGWENGQVVWIPADQIVVEEPQV